MLARLVNQTVGDALSDLLAVEAVLNLLNWTMEDWANIYSDYPNRLMKVKNLKILKRFSASLRKHTVASTNSD